VSCERHVVGRWTLPRLDCVALGVVVKLLFAAERAEETRPVHLLAGDGCLLVVELHAAHRVNDGRHGLSYLLVALPHAQTRAENQFVSLLRTHALWLILAFALHTPLTITTADG
jgi:hypothetical protein